jgi:hypothetical protein
VSGWFEWRIGGIAGEAAVRYSSKHLGL